LPDVHRAAERDHRREGDPLRAARDRRHRHRRPRPNNDGPYPYRTLRPLVQQARDAGLGVTIHVGEEGGAYGIAEIREVVSTLRPDRIGHGILAAGDEKLMTQICEAGIVLEICPTSNLLTKALEDEEALRETFRPFNEHNVQFTIATDGPEMMRTHLRDEFELLLRISALDESQVSEANRRGQDASFLPGESVV
jgi:adenosine deaminase